MSIRPIKRIIESRPAVEGAGVKLRRAFGFGNTEEFDPFLLFDDFRESWLSCATKLALMTQTSPESTAIGMFAVRASIR